MLEAILRPWPWYVSGPLIGLLVPVLLLMSGKALGISGSFGYLCSLPSGKAAAPGNPVKREGWKLLFALGVMAGGFVAYRFLSSDAMPIFPEHMGTPLGALQLLAGGFLVGFGSRYAEGCTSGHAIFGLATLQAASLMAVAGFFAGGLAAAGIVQSLPRLLTLFPH